MGTWLQRILLPATKEETSGSFPAQRKQTGLPAQPLKPVLPRDRVHLIYLRRGKVVTIDPHGPFPLPVDVQHDLRRLGERLVKDGHDDGHDEFHRREVVVDEEDFVLVGLLEFLIGPGEYLALKLGIYRHDSFYN